MKTLRFVSLTIIALLLGTLFIYTSSQASEAAALTPNTKIRINLDTNFSLNVRRTPAGEKIGTQRGQATGCVEETQGDWAKINYDEEEDGWSASRYLTAIGTCDQPAGGSTNRVKVNIIPGTTLTVRSTPAGDRVGTQPNGAEGTKIGEPQQANGRLWQQINFDQDPDGWVAANLIAPIEIAQKPDCPQRELPRMTRSGFTGWFGYERVTARDGQVDTYCFTVSIDTPRLTFNVGQRGVDQCLRVATDYIPPDNSGWSPASDGGQTSAYHLSLRSGFVPKGVWRIRVTVSLPFGCTDRYEIAARYY